jgi:hypothetical protein
MDVLTFIAKLVEAASWPVTSITLALIFRTEIHVLLQRLKKGKVGLAEFEFDEAVAALREQVGVDDSPGVTIDPVLATQADSDPRSVILRSWAPVHEVVATIVAKHATQSERQDPRLMTLRVLHRLLRDKSEYIDMYNQLRSWRNRSLHEADFSPRPSSAVEYASLSNELLAVLRPYAQ